VTITNYFNQKLGYSIDGRRLELTPLAFGGASLKIDGQKQEDFKITSKAPEQTVRLGDREVAVHCEKGRMRKVTVITRGREVFPTPKHVTPVRAQPGSMCGAHPSAPAVVACLRCGTFACVECCAADGTYCPACYARIADEAKARSSAMAYMAPILVFVALFGLLGGLLGGGAGLIAYTVAKRTSSRGVKIGVAVGVYAVAGVLCAIAAAAAIQAK
jgi:hypothetical protein